MPAKAVRREAAALLGYLCVALVFAWPLPLHLADAMLGLPNGDAGVYVWNLWVFRHEIVSNHQLPFLTAEILALGPQVPLALHNYTTFANVLAFPLIPIFGVLQTFNLLVLASGVMSGYAMYFYVRARTGGDAGSAWVAGLLFGFSPFMSARAAEHFSLTLAAPLPIFAWLTYRLYSKPSKTLACAAGATVAWAFLCDVYYAVYCLLIAGFMACNTMLRVEARPTADRRAWSRALVDLAIVCLAGFIVGIVLRGGGQVDVLGIRVSFTRLYTPVLMLTLMIGVRIWMAVVVRSRIASIVPLMTHAPTAAVAALVCIAILSPLLSATASSVGQRGWISPSVMWRNSAPGVDLLAYFVPNPLNPLFGAASFDWVSGLPGGFNENVASLPWVALLTIVGAVLFTGYRPIKNWLIFTGLFALLALGPFITIGQHLTYIPTPWAVLRYLPIIGAARTPTRLTIVVVMALAMLLAMTLQHLRQRTKRPQLLTFAIGALLFLELLPAPRTLHSAEIPAVYRIVAADPRPIRVLSLPFGLRDGLTSRGNYSASSQFYQTFHEKRLVGGYVSRLPGGSVERYRRNLTMRVLLRLSEGSPVEPELYAVALAQSERNLRRVEIGYVVIDPKACSPDLIEFAHRVFRLTLVTQQDGLELYRTPLAPPITSP
jgi:hypothetical protein